MTPAGAPRRAGSGGRRGRLRADWSAVLPAQATAASGGIVTGSGAEAGDLGPDPVLDGDQGPVVGLLHPKAVQPDSMGDVTERLVVEFRARADPCTVSRVVLDCCMDLRGVPVGALPELVERLARQRLLAVTDAR